MGLPSTATDVTEIPTTTIIGLVKNLDRALFDIKKIINIHEKKYSLEAEKHCFQHGCTATYNKWLVTSCLKCKDIYYFRLLEKIFWINLDLPTFDPNMTDLDNLTTLENYYDEKHKCIREIHDSSIFNCSNTLPSINPDCGLCAAYKYTYNSDIKLLSIIQKLTYDPEKDSTRINYEGKLL